MIDGKLLRAHEAPPVDLTPGRGGNNLLLVADHAGRAIPEALGDLGLPEAERCRHIGWDIGIAGLSAVVAERLGATLVRQRYSRLVIDCNRAPGAANAIVEVSDGTTIPGNVGLDAAAHAARVAAIHAPYHAAIEAEVDRLTAGGERPPASVADAERRRRPLVVALHSFTPVMQGFVRPWRAGVLHLRNSPASHRLLALLRAEPDLDPVGDNEPYAMDSIDYTVPRHAIARGLDYLEIEIRQDLIADPTGERTWGERVAGWIARVVEG